MEGGPEPSSGETPGDVLHATLTCNSLTCGSSLVQESTCDKSDLNCVLLNARSLRNVAFKFDSEVIDALDPDLVCITETWLSPEVSNCIFIHRAHYDIFRCDRDGHAGGVAILAKKKLKCFRKNWLIEHGGGLWLEITKPTRILIGLFYNNVVTNLTSMDGILCSIEDAISRSSLPIIVCGDFNQPNIDWENCEAPNTNGQDDHLNRFIATGKFFDFFSQQQYSIFSF